MLYVVFHKDLFLGRNYLYYMINDICNTSSLLKFILFADDTTIFWSGSNLNELSRHMSKELAKLSIWFAINKLSLNLAKTHFMVFSNHTKTSNITVCINETTIEMVYVNTFLGVLIDHKLKWKQHIKMITSKLSQTIAIMNRTKYILDKNARLILYYSLFLPYICHIVVKCGETPTNQILNACIFCRRK